MRKYFQKHPRTFVVVVFITGVLIGQLQPFDWIFWTIAETQIPNIKNKSLSEPSPFLSIPREKWILESDSAFVVESIDKEAPFHFLVIPKQRVLDITEVGPKTLEEMFRLTTGIVEKYKIKNEGFRIVINTNALGAQTVYHLHMHVLGGRQMRWPPG